MLLITIVNVMAQFEAYLMNVIYDRETFIVQATGAFVLTKTFLSLTFLRGHIMHSCLINLIWRRFQEWK